MEGLLVVLAACALILPMAVRAAVRFIWPWAPVYPSVALMREADRLPRLRAAVLQALGWLGALGLALYCTRTAQGWLGPDLESTPLEGHATVIGFVVGLYLAVPLGLSVQRLPRWMESAQLAGQIDADAAEFILDMPLWVAPIASIAMFLLPPPHRLLAFPVALALFWLLCGVRLAWAPAAVAGKPLWLVVVAPRTRQGGQAVAQPPSGAETGLIDLDEIESRRTTPQEGRQTAPAQLVRVAHHLAGQWRQGPVHAVLSTALGVEGAHARAVRNAGRADGLHLQRVDEIERWRGALPPVDRWWSLPLRELHVPPELLAEVAQRIVPFDESFIVVVDGDTELSAWIGSKVRRPSALCIVGDGGEELRGTLPSGLNVALVRWHHRKDATLKKIVAEVLHRVRGGAEPLQATDSPVEQPRPKVRLGELAAIAAALVAAAVLYGVLSYDLAARSDPVIGQIQSLRLSPPVAAVAQPAPRPRLAAFLEPDIRAGIVAVRDEVDRSVVTLQGDGLFAAASASVVPERVPLIKRIGDALGQADGNVLVTGHTDNTPMRTSRFPSNWHLSEERARTVKELLAANGVLRERIRGEGRADSEPVAPNDSPANRALNRRVEITLMLTAAPGR